MEFRKAKKENLEQVYEIMKNFKSRSKMIGFSHILQSRFFKREQTITETPVTKNATVESKNGDPKTAPNAISSPTDTFSPVIRAPKTATSGTTVSGNAVPIAANIPPTTPFDKLYSRPRFSTELVNNTQS